MVVYPLEIGTALQEAGRRTKKSDENWWWLLDGLRLVEISPWVVPGWDALLCWLRFVPTTFWHIKSNSVFLLIKNAIDLESCFLWYVHQPIHGQWTLHQLAYRDFDTLMLCDEPPGPRFIVPSDHIRAAGHQLPAAPAAALRRGPHSYKIQS